MSVREYIGARYVPVFSDPIQWDPTNVYEPLTVVTNQGASYVSRRMVPEGIQLDNTDYWVLWADFNAQLQHYIDEVETFDGRIDTLENKFPVDTNDIADDAITAAKIDDGAVGTAAIADDAITAAKIDDSAVGTAAIADEAITAAKLSTGVADTLTGLQNQIDLYKPKQMNAREWFYIDGVNGDDDNDGTQDHPFKTLNRWLSLQEEGYTDIRARIVAAGNYYWTDEVLSNLNFHLIADVANVHIYSNRYVFYGGRQNISCSVSGEYLHFHNNADSPYGSDVEMYGDFCFMSCAHIVFHQPFGLAGAVGSFSDCKFKDTVRLNSGTYECTNATGFECTTKRKLYMINSHARLFVGGGSISDATVDVSTLTEFEFTNCVISMGRSHPTVSGQYKYKYTISATTCILYINTTQLAAWNSEGLNNVNRSQSINITANGTIS